MYKNLKAEMIKQGVTAQQIALKLKLTLDTTRRKINCQIGLNMVEGFLIASLFSENNALEYLFIEAKQDEA